MPLRLLACDLDGTIANHAGHISDESLAAIRRARAENVLVVIATGRLYTIIDPFLDRLGVTGEPIISAQGALISHRDGRVLRRLTLDAAVAKEAAGIAGELGAGMVYFTERRIVADKLMVSQEQYQAWFGNRAHHDPQALEKLDSRLIKFMAIHNDPAVVPTILAELKRHLGSRADITRSWDWFVEGTAPGADKGAALAWLCQRLAIDREDVLSIGDGGNDVTMLQWAGIGVAPASGAPDAIAAADWVAPPIEEHPVAAAVARFL
jgi:Cof subfamily protein (haloacid dehalogenase superfamily)